MEIGVKQVGYQYKNQNQVVNHIEIFILLSSFYLSYQNFWNWPNLIGFHRLIESLKSNKIAPVSIPTIGYRFKTLILKNGFLFRTEWKLVCNKIILNWQNKTFLWMSTHYYSYIILESSKNKRTDLNRSITQPIILWANFMLFCNI